jgi:primosomal protein N'
MQILYKIEVAPLTILPFQKSIFSYVATEELALGTLVRIPFAGRNLTGVVVRQAAHLPGPKPLWMKEITGVMTEQTLTPEQVELAQMVSKENFTALGKVLKLMVPKQVTVRQSTLKEETLPFTFTSKNPSLDQNTKIIRALGTYETVFVESLGTPEGLSSLLSLVHRLLKKNASQILVLVPEIILLRLLEKLATEALKDTPLAILHSHLSSGAFFYHWQRIYSGEARVIFATRHGMFAPFKKLGFVFQIEPGSESYKQWDMSPRYHTESVLPLLQKIYGAKVLQYASLPPLRTLLLAEQKKAALVTLPKQKNVVRPEYINLRLERYQKNFSAQSKELEAALAKTLGEKGQALLFVHQGGLESFSVCKECKALFVCPECQSPLKLTKEETYSCKRCHFKSKLFPSCPQCKGIEFKSVGFGTQKVFREVQKRFPWSTVLLADKSVFFSTKSENVFFETLAKKRPDIVVCTEAFLRFSPLPDLSLVAIIDADSLLSFPGIERDERFLGLLKRSASQMQNCGAPRLLVQTFHPENSLFRTTEKESPEVMLEGILEERKLLSYPPVTRGIHIHKRPRKKGSEEALEKLFQELEKNNISSARLVTKQTKKGIEQNIALRYTPPLTDPLESLLARYADTTLIDHDPLTFF